MVSLSEAQPWGPGGVRFGCNLFSLIKRYGFLLITHAVHLGDGFFWKRKEPKKRSHKTVAN